MAITRLTKGPESPMLSDAMETVWHKGVVHIYPIPDAKLEELTAGYNSLYLVFFGMFGGAVISLSVTYSQITAMSQKPYYLAALIACIGLTIGFGIAGIGRYFRSSKAKRRLYQESIPLERPRS